MNLVYFTAGESLYDIEIRHQCVRIPEVTIALKDAQKSCAWDLLACMTLAEEFDRLADEQRTELIRIVQGGLLERFLRTDGGADAGSHAGSGGKSGGGLGGVPEMIFRSQFATSQALVNELRWRMRTGEPLTIFVVGPGPDEIPRLLADRRVKFVDVIDRDPQLSWFWPNLKRAAQA